MNGAFHGIEKIRVIIHNNKTFFFLFILFKSGGYKMIVDQIWWGRVPGVIDAYACEKSAIIIF